MNGLNAFRKMIAVTLAIGLGCCACRATPVSETSAAAVVLPTAAPRSSCWPRVDATPDARGTPLSGQTLGLGRVRNVAVSPNGETLAVAGGVGISLYRLDRIEWMRTLGTDTGRRPELVFSPDGTTLASWSPEGSVSVWDVATGQELHAFDGYTGKIKSVGFAPGGVLLASAEPEGPMVLWDVTTGEPARFLERPPGLTWNTAAFSPDGALLVTEVYTGIVPAGTYTGSAIVWDVATGEQVRVLPDYPEAAYRMVFSPDGTMLALGSDYGRLSLLDVETGKRLPTLAGHDPEERRVIAGLTFSPDGTMLASGAYLYGGEVSLWDVTSGERLRTLHFSSLPMLRLGHTTGRIDGLAFMNDGAILVTGLDNGRVVFWDTATGEQKDVLREHTGSVGSVVLAPDGATLASAAGNAGVRWPDVKLFSGAEDPSIIVWDAATGRRLSVLSSSIPPVSSTAFSPDGCALAFGTIEGTVVLWDVAAGRLLRTLEAHPGPVLGLAFSPNGATLATGSVDGSLVLWDAAAGRRLRTLDGLNSWVTCLAFAPDGISLAAGTSEYAVVLWNGLTGERIRTLEMPGKYVTGVAFAPDGRALASASSMSSMSGRGQVALWDTATGTCEMRIRMEPAISLAFSPDSRMLALVGKEVTVWDVVTHERLDRLQGRTEAGFRSVAFTADGTTLAAGGWDGTVTLWHLAEGDLGAAVEAAQRTQR